MNIEATKLELMQLLLQTQKEDILLEVKKVFEKEPTDWWDELSADEIDSINKGLRDVENGNIHEDKDVREYIHQRISKASK